jgi:hypothetical protein
MTPTQIIKEIRKLPTSAKRRILLEITSDLSDKNEQSSQQNEIRFLDELVKEGLLLRLPTRTSKKGERSTFRRVHIKGEPISETIIKERR